MAAVLVIPIGIDCGLSMFLRDRNMRFLSFPFDWVVSYKGVAECVSNDFAGFLPEPGACAPPSAAGIHFVHHQFPRDTEKMQRRIQRFKDALSGQMGAVVFIRKGHLNFHHAEAAELGQPLCDDVADAEAFATLLLERYPQLEFRVEVLLMCNRCHTPGQRTAVSAPRVTVYNIVLPDGRDAHLTDFLEYRLRPSLASAS